MNSAFEIFQPPEDPLPWNGTFDATKAPPICSQITIENKIAGQEDCLFLNVFTPNVSTPSTYLRGTMFISNIDLDQSYHPITKLRVTISLQIPTRSKLT